MRNFIVLLSLSILFSACSVISGGESLPDKRPDDLVLELRNSGGMLPESDHYYISKDSAFHESWTHSFTNRYVFQPDPQKLDDLYEMLKKNDALNIKSIDGGEVYDRGGASVWIRFDKKNFNISNSGNMFIDKGWQQQWRNVSSGILSFIGAGLDGRQQPVTLELEYSDSLPSIRYLHIDAGRYDFAVYNRSDTTTRPTTNTVQIHPGVYPLHVQCTFDSFDLYLDDTLRVNAQPGTVNMKIDRKQVTYLNKRNKK